MCIKWENTVEGNVKNPDLIGNLDMGSCDVDSRGNWKERERWVVSNTIASDLSGFDANPL